MNDKRDMAPMVWGYIKSRETARRMGAYAGEVTNMHPHFAYDSPARAYDLDLPTTKAYAGPNHISAGIQHGKNTSTVEANIKEERLTDLQQDPGRGLWSPGRCLPLPRSTPTRSRLASHWNIARRTFSILKNGVSNDET